jgi:hypothetical protein
MNRNRASKFSTGKQEISIRPLIREIVQGKCKPFVFFQVLVSSTQAIGASSILNDAMVFHVTLLMAGESADAGIEKPEDFIVNVLPGLIDIAPEDIYNADETGLFFKCLPNKTYGFSNKKYHSGKRSPDSDGML